MKKIFNTFKEYNFQISVSSRHGYDKELRIIKNVYRGDQDDHEANFHPYLTCTFQNSAFQRLIIVKVLFVKV